MAVIAYSRLSAIEEVTRTLQGDSSLGLFTITNMRSAFDENYLVMQRLVFMDADSESIKRDETRIAETNQAIDRLPVVKQSESLALGRGCSHVSGLGSQRLLQAHDEYPRVGTPSEPRA